MDFVTSILHLIGSGAAAYFTARNLRDPLTRPNTLAGFQLAESGSVPFLQTLQERAIAQGDEWLIEKLAHHASDERRHGQIFAQALQKLGKQVVDLKTLPENELAKRKRSPFFDTYFEGYSREELKAGQIDWLVFMGSTYILEWDAAKDFLRLANVLPEDELDSRALKKGLLSIAKDEARHAAYLHEGMKRRLKASEVDAIIEEWQTRKVRAIWAAVGDFLDNGGTTSSLVTDGAPPQPEVELLEVS